MNQTKSSSGIKIATMIYVALYGAEKYVAKLIKSLVTNKNRF